MRNNCKTRKYNKYKKSKKSNKSKKKIGGGLPPDIRTFDGKTYDVNTDKGLAAYDKAIRDYDENKNGNTNENENENTNENENENTKKTPRYKLIAFGMLGIGIAIGLPLLVMKTDVI
jgi:hypothetical protein